MLPVLLPAAGRSRRMGRPKLLLPWGDRPVVAGAVGACEEAGATPILLVVAAGDGELARWAALRGLRSAVNPSAEGGMLSTLWIGLRALGREAARGLLICPADLPALGAATVRAVLSAAAESPGHLVLPVHDGKRGHPLAVPGALVPEIETLDPAVGLRQLLERYPERILEIAVDDPGCVDDVDTPEDYARLAPVPDGG